MLCAGVLAVTGLISLIEGSVGLSAVALVVSFVILKQSAEFFVDGSIALAQLLRIPKVIIGIVLVSLATTSPELSVSMMSALQGSPEMAMGNAVGSVICNFGLGLALVGIVAAKPVTIGPRVLRIAGTTMLTVSLLCMGMVVFDGKLTAGDGAVLLAAFAVYMFLLFRERGRGTELIKEEAELAPPSSWRRPVLLFGIGMAGILASSRIVVAASTTLALWAGIPKAVVALTMIAVGTSVPEFATSITAIRRNQGAIAVGNILGANIMNVCWVAGLSSMANDLVIGPRETWFMFPSMLIMVIAGLGVLRHRYEVSRPDGFLLLALYALYIAAFALVFPIGKP